MLEITYTLQLITSLRIGTGIGVAGYLDNTVTRDGRGLLVIPGSTLKGKARATFYRLADQLHGNLHPRASEPIGCLANQPPCIVCRVFGAPHWPDSIHFEPAVLHPELQALLEKLDEERLANHRAPLAAQRYGRQVRTNVALDRRQRTAMADHLFTWEAVDPEVSFYGRITTPEGKSLRTYEIALLKAALGFITHLGGSRGRGLGRCTLTVNQVLVDGSEMSAEELDAVLRAESEVQ